MARRTPYARARIEGMMASAALDVAVIDADVQHDETLLPAMLAKLRDEGLDLIVGTRHAEGGSKSRYGNTPRINNADAEK